MSERNNQAREEVFSKSVRAGKRTYFFDVKATKSNDYYLTITESKKRIGDDGNPFYEKHKIFLYREDFDKFLEGYNEAVAKVGELKADSPVTVHHEHHNSEPVNHTPEPEPAPQQGSSFTDVNFDDLGN